MAWGTGTAMAHRAVDALMGPRVIHHETVASSTPAAAPVPNTTVHGDSDACVGQSKALSDVWFSCSCHMLCYVLLASVGELFSLWSGVGSGIGR
jgi:hypothetical protein